jgi:hypothetical protein
MLSAETAMGSRIGGRGSNAKWKTAGGCRLFHRRMCEMKLHHLLLAGILVLLAAAMVSCVLPNTATLYLKNSTGSAITAAAFTLQGETTGTDRLHGDTIPDGESYSFLGITPGTYDIILTVEGYGDYPAFTGLALEKNHWVYRNTPALP